MTLAWTPEAKMDRRAIHLHIRASNIQAAIDLDRLFSRRTVQLDTHPQLGRPGRVAGTRELVVHHNYIVVYDFDGAMVRIIRILHAARQWPPAPDE